MRIYLNYSKLGILIFGLSLLLTNCQKEEIVSEANLSNSIEISNSINVNEVDFSSLENNHSLINELELLTSKPVNKNSDKSNSDTDFSIDKKSLIRIKSTTSSLESYSFKINRTSSLDNIVENLVLTTGNNKDYKAHIIKYYFPNGVYNKDDFEVINVQEINSKKVSLFQKSSNGSTPSYYKVEIIEIKHKCYSGEHSGADEEGECDYAERGGFPPSSTYVVSVTETGTPNDRGGGLGQWGDGGGKTPGTGGSSGGSGGSGNGPVLTSPVIDYETAEGEFLGNILDDLSRKQLVWVRTANKTELDPIIIFLEKKKSSQSRYPQEAKEFVKSAIDAWIENKDAEVDFINEIIKDKSFVGTKADCVLNTLITSGNNLFKKTSQAFTDGKSKFQLRFAAKNDPSDSAPARTGFPLTGNIITIMFNLAVANDNSSAIDLAAIILHESIHAELHRIKLSNNASPNPLPSDLYNWYIQMWSYYEAIYDENFDDPYKVINKTATASQHNLMASRYINPIASGLREFDANSFPVENYKYYAWQGLLYYVKQNGYISESEISRLSILSRTVRDDNHKNPCDK